MRHSLMTFGGSTRRKRRKLVSESSEEGPVDEDPVGEFVDVDLESTHSSEQEPPPVQFVDDENVESRDELPQHVTAWVQRYANLRSQSGLVVSTKKKKEVAEWLRRALDYSESRLLMLGGPPGCGKSSVVHAVCKDLQCDIVSWQAPFVGSRGVSNALLEDFKAFFVGSRYPTLQLETGEDDEQDSSHTDRRVLLVEDLPIHITDIEQNKEVLRKIFFDAAHFAPHPTIVILSDGEKGIARLARILLGLDLLASPVVQNIKIPAVTETMMKRRLREVLAAENLSISHKQLDLVILASRGDMRAALNCLQLSSTATGESELNGIVRNSRKRQRSKRKNTVTPLAEIKHDLTLSTYHAISKVLNNKREQGGASKYVPEEVLDEARTDPEAFLSFLHQNYLRFFGNADDIAPTLLCLSEADTFLPWIQEGDLRSDLRDCAASVATRAFLHFNSSPVRSGWRPIKGPESHEVRRESHAQIQHANRTLNKMLRPRVFARSDACETVAYAEQIRKCARRRWGGSTNTSGPSGRSVFDHDADVAMVDLESTMREPTVMFRDDLTKETVSQPGFGSEHEEEDIEEWDD